MTCLDVLEEIPNLPGIYIFFNIDNAVLYVGTSSKLQVRLKNHFKRVDNVNLLEISYIRYWIFKDISTKQRIMLEKAFVKKYKPKYNQNLQDIMEKESQKFKDFFIIQVKIQVLNWFFLPFQVKTKDLSFYPFHVSKSTEEMDDLKIIKLIFSS